jgi:hypothetical protein
VEHSARLQFELARCRPWIEAALQHSGGTHEWQDVVGQIAEGRLQFWPAERGCAVTEIVVYPQVTVLNIFLAGGELDQLLDMEGDAFQWAKAQGCKSVTLSGRLGWQRALKSRGWKPTHINLSRELT